jgi:hypothetical protein
VIARSVRVTLIAAAGIWLAVPVLAQHTFSSGETSYNRHVASLLAPYPGPKLEPHARALSELGGELWLAAALAVNSLETCRSESGSDAMAAARCVNDRAVAVLTPEALSTEIEPYCAYKTHLDKRPEAGAGCFLRSWRDISSRSLSMHAQIERSSACSYPDLVRLRELHANLTERYVEQVIALDALLDHETGRNKQRAPYVTLRPDHALEQLNRAQTLLAEAHERAQEFEERLAADSPPIKVGTLIVISTAQQRFASCLNRHPERARQWEETFAAYKEGAPASSLAWVDPVPTVPNAQPIDVRGAARRTFEAMVRAHERPPPTPPDRDEDLDPAVAPKALHDLEEALETCNALNEKRYNAVREYAIHQARLAKMTGSVWAGCGDEFLWGAVGGLGQDLSSGVSFEAAARSSRRPFLAALFRHSGYADLSGAAVNAAARGIIASRVCRSQNERPLRKPTGPGLDDDGKPISSLFVQGGGPTPGSATIGEMQELISDAQSKINAAEGSYKRNCIAKLQGLQR